MKNLTKIKNEARKAIKTNDHALATRIVLALHSRLGSQEADPRLIITLKKLIKDIQEISFTPSPLISDTLLELTALVNSLPEQPMESEISRATILGRVEIDESMLDKYRASLTKEDVYLMREVNFVWVSVEDFLVNDYEDWDIPEIML